MSAEAAYISSLIISADSEYTILSKIARRGRFEAYLHDISAAPDVKNLKLSLLRPTRYGARVAVLPRSERPERYGRPERWACEGSMLRDTRSVDTECARNDSGTCARTPESAYEREARTKVTESGEGDFLTKELLYNNAVFIYFTELEISGVAELLQLSAPMELRPAWR